MMIYRPTTSQPNSTSPNNMGTNSNNYWHDRHNYYWYTTFNAEGTATTKSCAFDGANHLKYRIGAADRTFSWMGKDLGAQPVKEHTLESHDPAGKQFRQYCEILK